MGLHENSDDCPEVEGFELLAKADFSRHVVGQRCHVRTNLWCEGLVVCWSCCADECDRVMGLNL